MNFLENLPGGRAGEAHRSDAQSRVSRQIPVNVPAPLLVPEKRFASLGSGGLACAPSWARRARAELAPETPASEPNTSRGGNKTLEHSETRIGQ